MSTDLIKNLWREQLEGSLSTEAFWEKIKSNVKINFAGLYINHKCNLRCIHCFWGTNKTFEKELSFEEWENILRQLQRLGTQNFHICGKEPFLSPEILIKMLSYLQSQKNVHTSIITNGMYIAKYINQLKEYPPNRITFSIDGNESSHDQIRGKGTFSVVVRNLDVALDNLSSSSNITVVTVLNKLNFTNIESFIRGMNRKNIKLIFIQPELLYGRPKDAKERLLSPNELSKVITSVRNLLSSKEITLNVGFLIPPTFTFKVKNMNATVRQALENYFYSNYQRPEVEVNNSKIYFRFHPFCTASWNECRISADGYLLGCDVMMGALDYRKFAEGNFRNETLEEMLKKVRSGNSKANKALLIPHNIECRKCGHFNYCRSGCRVASKIYYNSWLEKDPLCYKNF